MLKKLIAKTNEQLLAENDELNLRLTEAEETLNAIRRGEVDAIVGYRTDSEQIYSLKPAETPFRVFIEEINEGAVTLSSEGIICYCNRRFAELVNEPIEQLIGSSFMRFIPLSDQAKFDTLMNQALYNLSNKVMASSISRNSKTTYIQLSISHLPPGIPGDICIIITDITELIIKENKLHELHGVMEKRMDELRESRINSMITMEDALEAKNNIDTINKKLVKEIAERKRAEGKLNESEAKFKKIYEEGPMGIALVNTDLHFIMANATFCRMIGYNDQELKGLTFKDITHPDYVSVDLENISKLLRGEISTYKTEKRYIRKDNQVIWGSLTASVHYTNDGHILYLIAIIEDITERKRIEETLKESQLNYSIVADNTYDWEFWRAPDDRYLYLSPSCKRITGYNAKDFIKNMELIRTIIHPDDLDSYDRHRHIERTEIKPATSEFRIIAVDGQTKWIDHVCQPIFDKDGIFLGTRGSNRDITDRKKIEKALKENEIRLDKLNATKDKFFSIIAHDLKSPFNSIIGYSDLLTNQVHEKNYDEIEKYAEIIQKSSLQAMTLLSNLMDWSRSQTGRMEFTPENIEITELINEVTQLLNHSAIQKSITMYCESTLKINTFADKAMISNILRNLISNAIKFTYPGGEIVVSAEQKQNNLLVSVSDNGVGIKKDAIEKLFRIDVNYSTIGTQNEKGTGLGLLLCKEFIEKHGGEIWVESKVGKGSKFCFTIPNG